jgi:hypothetical protein
MNYRCEIGFKLSIGRIWRGEMPEGRDLSLRNSSGELYLPILHLNFGAIFRVLESNKDVVLIEASN